MFFDDFGGRRGRKDALLASRGRLFGRSKTPAKLAAIFGAKSDANGLPLASVFAPKCGPKTASENGRQKGGCVSGQGRTSECRAGGGH